jgi:hypothetical protein
MSDREFFHDRFHDDELQLLVPGAEDMTVSFVGREDTRTVTCYVIDPETQEPQAPLFECDAEHFDMLLEQASGALMDARGETDHLDVDHQPTGAGGDSA